MELLYRLTNFLIGSCLASHAAVVCDRYPQIDFLWGRSRCASCQTELSLLDELPIISYLYLHGHCRYCKQAIPAKLFFTEVIGGWAFLTIDFSRLSDLLTALLIFSLLVTALCDSQEREFDLVFLLPAFFCAGCHVQHLFTLQLIDYIDLVPILFILVSSISQGKLGSGDLLIYLVLAVYFSPAWANQIFLSGCLFLLGQILLEYHDCRPQQTVPFVPYLFLGLVVQLLINN